ncbi:hypothetical protein M409DRAFT_52851 [Zasmidium cellare ATCC 36951]|uniref:Zn(2)-C6 fungal-type domain-containing protein n=1 Tax=Zasmidium cellare ATCC 36951 TaxID=1080233 RepID=A0A6A6CRT2_ZASCE|nr:uncharacterized protein M409DRAFT_52851 [Zasmidium cellare ATCC 36951]KAF2168850.1 hypothetical protein M409DRAFT_52851 [Zasmidium cellare ATCC 36951]
MSQIKYRAACDHCSATKIKCTQERPQCARCRALGRDCHYSRSLRAGKPPRSSQGLNRKLSNPPVLPRQSTPTETIVAAPYPTPPAVVPNNGADGFQFPELPPTDGSSSSTSPMGPEWFFDFNNGSDLINDLRLPNLPEHGHEINPSDLSPGHNKQGQTPSSMEFTRFEDLINMPPPTPVMIPSSNSSNSDTDKCARLATETLHSLYEMPTTHIDSTGAKQPSVDQALSTTARAVQNTHDLITCSCAKDFYLPMLIAIIASKIIAWYQAVAFVRDPYTELPEGKQCSKEVVVEAPLTLGAYQLDDKVGWVLKNQIVLGQLQRLNEVISRYNALYCVEGSSGHLAEGTRLYGSMGGFLKSRLQFTVQEIESRLKASGHGSQ